jgi:hypothetical protein
LTEWEGWKAVVRDVVIIWVMIFIGAIIGGVIIEIAELKAGTGMPVATVVLSTYYFCIIGFCISGCMIKYDRWKHLCIVALFTWLSSCVVTIFPPVSLLNWFFSIIVFFIMMGMGGGISFLIVKPNRCVPSPS